MDFRIDALHLISRLVGLNPPASALAAACRGELQSGKNEFVRARAGGDGSQWQAATAVATSRNQGPCVII